MQNHRRHFTPVRFGLVCLGICCCLGLLLARVGWLQIISPDNLVKQEDMRSLREEPIAVPRGMITDRKGRPLAVSVPVSAVWVDPQTLLSKGGVGYNERWQALASALHMSLADLTTRISEHPNSRFFTSHVRLTHSRPTGLTSCICRALICATSPAAFIPPGTLPRT